jgi:hypothetical protein
MGKEKKRTIKFLRNAEKHDTGKKKMGRKKPKKDENSMELTGVEVEKVLSVKGLKGVEEGDEEGNEEGYGGMLDDGSDSDSGSEEEEEEEEPAKKKGSK